MHLRLRLLETPVEMFRQYFGGRVPSLWEKTLCIERAVQTMNMVDVYENDTYHVDVNFAPPFAHLAIRRLDGKPCKEWLHFQQIKNEVIGPENEAMEIFPAESRLVDSADEYHLWVHTDPKFRFPVGFGQRFVLSDSHERNFSAGRDTAVNHALA
jgi:hypothetical protein